MHRSRPFARPFSPSFSSFSRRQNSYSTTQYLGTQVLGYDTSSLIAPCRLTTRMMRRTEAAAIDREAIEAAALPRARRVQLRGRPCKEGARGATPPGPPGGPHTVALAGLEPRRPARVARTHGPETMHWLQPLFRRACHQKYRPDLKYRSDLKYRRRWAWRREGTTWRGY